MQGDMLIVDEAHNLRNRLWAVRKKSDDSDDSGESVNW